MGKFKHVIPSKKYEGKAIDYINEFYKYGSQINGVGGLRKYLDNYDKWLQKLDDDKNSSISEEHVPTETFFLVRTLDDKIFIKEEISNLKQSHLKRIEMSDAIFVINKNKYIGDSTRKEIEYAKKLGKKFVSWNIKSYANLELI